MVLNPGPQVPPVLHVLDVSLLQHTWFKWMGCYLVMQKPVNDHSFESGVLEQGNIQNVQDRGYLRTRVENHCPKPPSSQYDCPILWCHITVKRKKVKRTGYKSVPNIGGMALVQSCFCCFKMYISRVQFCLFVTNNYLYFPLSAHMKENVRLSVIYCNL